jgi:hypothetical protein
MYIACLIVGIAVRLWVDRWLASLARAALFRGVVYAEMMTYEPPELKLR